MVQVAPIRLQYNPKTLWFDPNGLDVHNGDAVIVKTERGLEFGHALDPIEVTDDDIANLKTKLKPVMRKAEEKDLEEVDELRRKGEEALPVFKRLAAECNENMRPVMVEYLFGGDRAVFFFEAEERIDFRDLVRKLASELNVRVDMRQIGVRDEACLIGGLGHCGQELCCKRLGGEFNPVSIRMAKEQDLSLNPAKISGVCGRLMCCLRYEYDAYKDFKSRAPKMNARIDTPCGSCKVCELNVPNEMVSVQMEEGGTSKKVTFPLSAMDTPSDGGRPTRIGEVFDEYANPDPFAGVSLGSFDTAAFTHDDQLAQPVAHHNPTSKDEEEGTGTGKKRRRRRRSRSSGKDAASSQEVQKSQQHQEQPSAQRNRRRRRGGQGQSGASTQKTNAVRPGKKSSGLSNQDTQAQTRPPVGETQHRKKRRRTHKAGSSSSDSN